MKILINNCGILNKKISSAIYDICIYKLPKKMYLCKYLHSIVVCVFSTHRLNKRKIRKSLMSNNEKQQH